MKVDRLCLIRILWGSRRYMRASALRLDRTTVLLVFSLMDLANTSCKLRLELEDPSIQAESAYDSASHDGQVKSVWWSLHTYVNVCELTTRFVEITAAPKHDRSYKPIANLSAIGLPVEIWLRNYQRCQRENHPGRLEAPRSSLSRTARILAQDTDKGVHYFVMLCCSQDPYFL